MKITRKLLVSIIVVLFILCKHSSVSIARDDKTLRVGYMDYSGFIDKNSDNTYSGYATEYLARISEYTGYKYDYVYDEWPDLLRKLQNKEIDILCNAQYTDERAKIFDYCKNPIGYTQGILYAKKDNSSLYYEDFKAFNGINVGIIQGSAMEQLFLNYKKQHNFSCNIIEAGSEEKLLQSLESGEVDAICTEYISNHTGLSLIGKYGADAFYIISYKGSPFIEDINYAVQEIKSDVDYETNLYHKYYDNSTAATALQFTTDESEYIKQHNNIRVALNAARPPFSEYDEKTGTFKGVCVDLLNEISKESGLVFTFISQPNGMTPAYMLKTGDYDVICGVDRDNFLTNKEVEPTDAFMKSSIVPVGRAGTRFDLNRPLIAALPSSFQALQKNLIKNYPEIKLEYYDTNRDCMDAVLNKKADFFIQNTHLLGMLLQEPKYEKLDILPIKIMTEHTTMAIKRGSNPILLSIINKSIAHIDDATVSSSLIEHTFSNPYHYTTMDLIHKLWPQLTIIFILIILCFVLLFRIMKIRHKGEMKLQKKNEQLTEAVAQADRANTAKSQFLSSMSHEIRTPMNAIVGITEVARHYENDAAKIDSYLDKIQISSKVLLNIINDVLDMSAIESNKLKIAKEEFDIKQVLSGISAIYYPQCRTKGIEFEMESNLEKELLIGDSLRVNQILMNLVSNAYKFTASGGKINIYVEETGCSENTVFIKFVVSDTGIGMSKEMQERLFKPFEQEGADTARKFGGSGLGLSIMKNLIDMMHGAIDVTSKKGEGTTFTVNLPFKIHEKRTAAGKKMLNTLKIMLIDNNIATCEYTSIVLKRIGVEYDIASDADEAISDMRMAIDMGKPYNVCLLDWEMKNDDSSSIVKKMRQNHEFEKLIIIVSSYDRDEIEYDARKCGVDYFVSKPIFQLNIFNIFMTITDGNIGYEKAEPDHYDFSGYRVLLAEDNQLNAEIAIELLGLVNMEVDRASDGCEAVSMFESSEPGYYHLILMDVQMPNMNGYEATREIRAFDRFDASDVPIYAMTANAFTEDISAALSAGMNGHIAKPINTNILYEIINNIII